MVDRKQLPADLNPQIGQQLQSQQPNGQIIVVTVIEVSDSSVTIDANPPLAGIDLTFDLQLVEIVS